jgi:lysine-arginine-ornithine-binding protein
MIRKLRLMRDTALAALLFVVCSCFNGTAGAQGLRIGTEGAYPPFEYRDASGTLKGMDVEIGNALCEIQRIPCQFMPQDFDGLIPALKAGKIDIIISSMSVTPERAKVVAFTKPYYISPTQYVALKSSGITDDPATLKGKTVAVQSGTNHQAYMEQNLSDIAVKTYNTVQEAELDLEAGRVDAMLADKLLMYDWLEKAGKAKGFDYVGKPLVGPLVNGQIAIGVSKDNSLMLESFNTAIDKLLADPRYEQITKAYFPFPIRP